MGDAVQKSCPTVMDIYCFFWTVGAGHTHALILMSPPAASCCSPLFLFSCYLLFLGVFAVFQQLSVPRSRGGKSDADTQRQSGDSEAASRLNSRITSETWRLLRRPISESQLHPESIWTLENHIYLFSICNRRAQSQYVTSKTRIIFLEQQRLKHS